MTTTIRLRKAADFDPDLPTYDVLVDDEVVGQVWRGWFRDGGTQWTHRTSSIGYAGRSRKTAVTHLLQQTLRSKS